MITGLNEISVSMLEISSGLSCRYPNAVDTGITARRGTDLNWMCYLAPTEIREMQCNNAEKLII